MADQKPQRGVSTLTSTVALKRTLGFFALAVFLVLALSAGISRLFTEDVVILSQETAKENLLSLWKSYQHYYIVGGRVIRPKNDGDTVSEGQAYGMLRAVWQNDRATFDEIYYWTEANLSRFRTHGDHLLAWRYGPDRMGGMTIIDDNPAVDADLDYALALFLANKQWPDNKSPLNTLPYHEKGLAILDSLMNKVVVLHQTGELALLPWPVSGAVDERGLLLNPSYFSPGHYRIFEMESGDSRWAKLASDTYRQLGRLLQTDSSDGRVVTAPDWIIMRPDGRFVTDPNRGYVSGWDAFRIWWRLRLDYDISGNLRARELIETRLIPFLEKSMEESGGDVASESDRDGMPNVKYSNPGMGAVYRWATRDFDPVLSRSMQRLALRYLDREGGYVYYQDKDDYYTNSWAWFANPEDNMNFPQLASYSNGGKNGGTQEVSQR